MKPFDIELPFQNMYRQAIINGNFDIWQRGASFTTFSKIHTYTADRWKISMSSPSTFNGSVIRGEFSPGQTEVPNNPKYFASIKVNAVTTQSWIAFNQRIETLELFSDKLLTLSFWLRSNIDTSLSISPTLCFGSGGSANIQILSSVQVIGDNKWHKYVVTTKIPSLSSKVFGSGSYLDVEIGLPKLSTFSIDIAQVQLCEGGVALPFMPRSFHEELMLCMRYFQKSINYEVAPGTIFDKIRYSMVCTGTTIIQDRIDFAVPMRYTPTIEYQSALEASAKWSVFNGTSWVTCAAAPTTQNASDKYFNINITCPFTPTKNYTYLCQGYWTADAEL